MYIEGESSDFAEDFALVGLLPIVLRASRHEFGDEVVTVEFVGHLSEEISERNGGLAW